MDNQESNPLSFRPITEGLGFHPFEEGLPYAPVNPKKLYPAQPQPVKTTPQITSSVQFQLERALKTPTPAAKITQVLPPPTKAPQKNLSSVTTTEFNSLYVSRRIAAFLLDATVLSLLAGGLLFFTFPNQDLESFFALDTQDLILAGIFYASCHWGLITAQEVAFGTSLGKLAFNLRLPGSGFDVFLRAILFLPSVALGGLGILLGLFDEHKRCWHDRVTRIQPINLDDSSTPQL